MFIFKLLTPITYWVLIVMWSFVLLFYLKRLGSEMVKGRLISILLIILSIDAFRTLFESVYFGAWYTSLAGFLPQSVYTFLVRPEMVFIPKIINVIAAAIIIGILLYRWLPQEEQEKNQLEKLIQQRNASLTQVNQQLQNEIAERKQAEALLIKQRYFLEKAQTIGKIGSWELDIRNNKLLWTDENYHIFGIPVGTELTYETFLDCVHPDDREYVDREWKASFSGKPYEIEHRLLVDDTVKWVREKAELEFNDQDECIRGTGFTQDITAHKRAVESLRESEKRFQDITHSLADWIWEVDKNGKYTYVSDSVKNILGYSSEELIGKTPFELMSAEEGSKISKIFFEALSKSRPIVDLENWNLAKDGAEICLLSNGVPIMDVDGVLIGYRGVDKDITNQKKLESEKTAIEARLLHAQKMESIGTLAGGIAHDFNNILFPLLGFAEMLKEDVPSDSPLQAHIDQILRSALRSKDLVKQILTFSRQGEQDLKPIKLQPIIKEALKLLRSSIPTTIDIQQDIDSGYDVVVADPAQVHQIIMNLATNAYHAMEGTGGRLNVTLKQIRLKSDRSFFSELPPGKYAHLTVADTGTGIENDIMEKIFDPYFTTKETGKGTGLGLSVVRGIVKSCNGDIRVDSEPGKGTKFHVVLPVLDRKVDDRPMDRGEPIPVGTETILLVDDEAAIVKTEQQMLERLGYQVTTRTRSAGALEAFKANPASFDLVLTDMTMPNMTGDQLAKEVISIKPGMPVIICTGFSDGIDKEKAEAFGVKGFLMKPVAKSDMAKMVRKVLDEAKHEA